MFTITSTAGHTIRRRHLIDAQQTAASLIHELYDPRVSLEHQHTADIARGKDGEVVMRLGLVPTPHGYGVRPGVRELRLDTKNPVQRGGPLPSLREVA